MNEPQQVLLKRKQVINKYMKKMFDIFSHWRNVNQNYMEILST